MDLRPGSAEMPGLILFWFGETASFEGGQRPALRAAYLAGRAGMR